MPGPPRPWSTASVSEWPAYVEAAAAERFDAQLGLLGDTRRRAAAVCVKAVGRWPRPVGGARSDGQHRAGYVAWSASEMLEDLNACPVTLVDVGSLRDPDDVAEGETVARRRASEQLTEIDTRIGQVIEAGPNGADYVVASLSDAGDSERLRLVVARGPHFGPGRAGVAARPGRRGWPRPRTSRRPCCRRSACPCRMPWAARR